MARKMSCREVTERVSRWANVTKVIMGICFSILFVLGMALFLSAAVALADFSIFAKLGIPNIKSVIAFALCLGLFIAIVSILGALGYFTLNRVMLIVFVCGIAILIVLEVICGATAFAFRNNFENITKDAWELADNESRAFIEETYNCCGGANLTDKPASAACTANDTFDFEEDAVAASGLVEPCYKPVSAALTDNINGVCIGDIVITVLEIAVIIVTAFVLHEVKNANTYTKFQGDDPSIESMRG